MGYYKTLSKAEQDRRRGKYVGAFPHPTHKAEESRYFPTWGELLKFAEDVAGCGQGSSIDQADPTWRGSRDMPHALDIARNGWAEGVALAMPLCTEITNRVTSLIEVDHVFYDVEGIGLDIAAYLDGEPECWQKFEKTTGEGDGVKHIRIVMDATVSAGIDQSVITARGAAVAALIQGLEFASCRVQLEVLPLCNGRKWESRVLVKAADQELDMSRVIFATAHPSMLRRIGFAVQEGCPRMDGNSGYGPCSEAEDKGDIYIGGAMLGEAQWRNVQSATEWVLRKIVEQGIKLTA